MYNKELANKVEHMTGVNVLKCMRCGKCSATCPSYESMTYHPHQFVYMVEKGDIDALLESGDSLYKCLSCMACLERCPRGVEPSKVVEAVRLIKIRQQGQNHLKPESIPPMAAADEDLPQQLLMSAFRKYSK